MLNLNVISQASEVFANFEVAVRASLSRSVF